MITYSIPNYLKGIFILILLQIIPSDVSATHLAGGQVEYRYLGGNQYEVSITAYRDCNRDADPSLLVPFDSEIVLCIYKAGSGELLTNISVKLNSKDAIAPLAADTGCVPPSEWEYYERGIYTAKVTLPASSSGYHLKWERCCRSRNNLRDMNGEPYQGETYYAFIPASDLANNSVVVNYVPIPHMCIYDTATFSMNVYDPDGDSLSYAFVTPWRGASLTEPLQQSCMAKFALPGVVEYVAGFSTSAHFGDQGFSGIDPITGIVRLRSSNLGVFALTVEVTEWRNGIAINKTRIDQTAIVADPTATVKRFQNDVSFSVYPNPVETDLNISIKNAGMVKWHFADATGRTVLCGNAVGDFSLNTAEMANGFYSLTLEIAGKKSSQSVVVQH
jgi:hypothetical protein